MRIEKPQNKSENPIQITAEQIIRASHEYVDDEFTYNNIFFDNQQEFEEYKSKKRLKFEEQTQRNKYNISIWYKYADWEERLKEYNRVRNIYERAIDVDYTNVSLWLKYIEMEIRGGFVNHARNLWERAIKLLPKEEQLWFKYAYMEELIGNYIGTREIFKNWMTWKPTEKAYIAYFLFEERMNEVELSRKVLYEYIKSYPNVESYIKVSEYEENKGNINSARELYEKCMSELGREALKEKYFLSFSKFEIRNKSIDRARLIIEYGIESITRLKKSEDYENIEDDENNDEIIYKSKNYCPELYEFYNKFKKIHGTNEGIEELVLKKRYKKYMQYLIINPNDYRLWLSVINLKEEMMKTMKINEDLVFQVRDLYEKAISNVPNMISKIDGNNENSIWNIGSIWKFYITIWLKYAIFEMKLENNFKVEKIYTGILDIVKSKVSSSSLFDMIYLAYAEYLLNQDRLSEMRLLFGQSIGNNPSHSVFQKYIHTERRLGNYDRCRKLYEKYVFCFVNNPFVWVLFALFEEEAKEFERAKMILLCSVQVCVDYVDVITRSGIYKRLCVDDVINCGKGNEFIHQMNDGVLSLLEEAKKWGGDKVGIDYR